MVGLQLRRFMSDFTDPIVDTPESPPVEPVIPVGLSTRLLQIVGAAFAAVSAVTAVLNGDHSQETITFAVLSATSFFFLAGGRYAQAVARELRKVWEV
jgi:hypothetical protein